MAFTAADVKNLREMTGVTLARPYAQKLYSALLTAEDIYVDTAPYVTGTEEQKVIQLRIDKYPEE